IPLAGSSPGGLIVPLLHDVRYRAERHPATLEAGTFEPAERTVWWSDSAVSSASPAVDTHLAQLRPIGTPPAAQRFSALAAPSLYDKPTEARVATVNESMPDDNADSVAPGLPAMRLRPPVGTAAEASATVAGPAPPLPDNAAPGWARALVRRVAGWSTVL